MERKNIIKRFKTIIFLFMIFCIVLTVPSKATIGNSFKDAENFLQKR